MNDLAEKALHALNVAQAGVRARPTISLAASGFVISTAVAVLGARAEASRTSGRITSWFGLLRWRGGQHTEALAAVGTLIGVVSLLALWGTALAVVRRRSLSESRVWLLAAAWSLPFVLGPPLFDTHVYLDVARGLMQRNGIDPYAHPITVLGAKIVNAVDPSSQGMFSAAGPLSSFIQHLAVAASGGHALGAVLLLRALAVVAVIGIGRAAADLAGARRARAVVLTVLNPLVLFSVVSACHLDGLAVAFLLAALVSANQRRWGRAVLLAAVAGCITPPLLVALPVFIAVHARGRRGQPAWQVAARDAAVGGAVVVSANLAVRHGYGWIHTAWGQFSEYLPYAPANALGRLLAPIVPGASFDNLAAGGRLTAAIAVVAIVGYLIVTAQLRPLEHSTGYALLAVALLAPDVYPWFLLWGVCCLGPSVTGLRRSIVMILSGTACLLSPPGFSDRAAHWLSAGAIGAAAVLLLVAVHRSGELAQRPPEISRTAGRTSAR